VTGGNLADRNGGMVAFAGPDASLIATASGSAAVEYFEYDGTPIISGDTLQDLADYSGQTLMVMATNTGGGDSTVQYVNVYGATAAPALLPDNYDDTKGSFTFTANYNTGAYTVTGQTDPGALISGATADGNGRFAVTGSLTAGENSALVTLAVSNEAGMATLREVSIVRAPYVKVTGITGVPAAAKAGTPLALSGTAIPSNATNQTIVWTVLSAGATGATISGNTLKTTAAGTVTVRATIANGLTPSSNYTQNFNITVSAAGPVSISDAVSKKIEDKAYTGKSIKPVPVLTIKNVALKKGTDYTVSYKNNTKIGKATVTVTGKGKYTGTKTITFKIVPKKTSVSKATPGKGQLKITWKKVSAAQKVTKYEIRYKIKGAAKWQTKSVSANSANVTIGNLQKGKAYQVQVRSCKTVSKVKYYSEWSKVKTSRKVK
jgi:hypothetical protein